MSKSKVQVRTRFPLAFGWYAALLPTDVDNLDQAGEALYVWAKVRPAWYWWWKRVRLFAGLVWRDGGYGARLSAETAWAVAGIIHGSGLTHDATPWRLEKRDKEASHVAEDSGV